MTITTLIFFISITTIVIARKGYGPTEQEWGYVTVRPGAHLFWWFHQTSADVDHYTDRPLIIWVQGGPGVSSTGFGNFFEIGPLDLNLNPRNTTLLNDVNLLFVDNPVGTGFSYVDDQSKFATTNQQIAQDFLVLLKDFYRKLPEMMMVPVYIFGESYGGKMTPEIALVLNEAIESGELNITLKGIALGDPSVSFIDLALSYAPYLLSLGFIDRQGYKTIECYAKLIESAFNNGDYGLATDLSASIFDFIKKLTDGVDIYNILEKIDKNDGISRLDKVGNKLDKIMNNQVKNALKLHSTWNSKNDLIMTNLREDHVKPVTKIVETLLNTTDIKISIYNGQFDLIINTLGIMKWMDGLKFRGSSKWQNASRYSMVIDGVVEGYVKKIDNFAMYWVNRAGHLVPIENVKAMRYILADVLNNSKN